MRKIKPVKEVKWDGKYLWLRTNGTERKLGHLRTIVGQLTREAKLKAVEAGGDWVKV